MKSEGSDIPTWAMPALSWLVSFYFMLGFVRNVGFPPDRELMMGDIIFVALWLLFLFLPFYTKVKLGNFVELERELQRTQEDMQSFKTELRNSIAVLSTSINTIGNINNQITLNVPGLAELREARQLIEEKSPQNTTQQVEEVEQVLRVNDDDTVMALARTRIEMERLLRVILGKRTSLNELRNEAVKFYGTRQLFDMFVRENEAFSYLREPFNYVLQVCNAAIHAQEVSEVLAREALALGAEIIAVLTPLAQERAPA